jgi:signal transduction histidine kinase
MALGLGVEEGGGNPVAQEPADWTFSAGLTWPTALLTLLDGLEIGILLYDERQIVQMTNAPMRRLVPERLWPVTGRSRAELLEGFGETFIDAGLRALTDAQSTDRQTGDLVETRGSPPAIFEWRSVRLGTWMADTFRAVGEDVLVARETLEFVANAAHDLKTPLTSIKGFAQLALRRLPASDDRLTVNLQTIAGQADQLVRLIDTMSDAARLQSGLLAIRRHSVDLAQLVDASMPKGQDADRRPVVVRIEPVPLVGQWDGARLGRALARVIDNAIKYSPPEATVTIAGRVEGDQVLITVEDSGPGIPAEEIPRLLEQSLITRRSPGLTGSGLGLFLARGIVEAHQGTLEIDSRPGAGTRVFIRLPLGA